MRALSILVFPLCFTVIACKNASQGLNDKSNTISAEKQDTISFVPENKDGFILPDTLIEYNKDLSYKCLHIIPRLEKIKILSATKNKYYLPHDSDECKEANFLEILYQDKRLIVSGKDVYQIDNQKPLNNINTIGNNSSQTHYELYSATNFAVGAADDNGLTGCDDYSVLILRRLPNDAYSLVENTDSYSKYTVLRHDDGADDTISNIKSSGDTIILNIGVQEQTGTESYKIKILYNEKLCKATITDRILQTDGKYYDENGNEIKK